MIPSFSARAVSETPRCAANSWMRIRHSLQVLESAGFVMVCLQVVSIKNAFSFEVLLARVPASFQKKIQLVLFFPHIYQLTVKNRGVTL